MASCEGRIGGVAAIVSAETLVIDVTKKLDRRTFYWRLQGWLNSELL